MFAPCAISATSRPDQLSGFDLYEGDRDLGELEEVVQLGPCLYFVLDARHWAYGARKLLPVTSIERVDEEQRRAFASLDRDQIRGGPDFDPFQLTNERFLDDVDRYFAGLGHPGPADDPPRPGEPRPGGHPPPTR